MTYTTEEKIRMDVLLKLFDEYIKNHEHFEIVYSSKIGFITFAVHKGIPLNFDWIDNFDDLLDTLFSEILSDVRDLNLQGQHDDYRAFPIEINEARRRIGGILLRMDDPGEKTYCMNAMEKFLMENALEDEAPPSLKYRTKI